MSYYGGFETANPQEIADLIVCNLTKPETTLDQVKKAHPKLKPTDAALMATAIVLSGRFALVAYDEKPYRWPEDFDGLKGHLISHIRSIEDTLEVKVKKTAKTVVEEEAIEIKLGLSANFNAGEKILGEREDLKTLLSDLLTSGVEYHFSPTDIGWQWMLDRANWTTIGGQPLARKIKFKCQFADNSVGVEMTSTGARKRTSKAKAAPVAEAEPEAEVETVSAD